MRQRPEKSWREVFRIYRWVSFGKVAFLFFFLLLIPLAALPFDSTTHTYASEEVSNYHFARTCIPGVMSHLPLEIL